MYVSRVSVPSLFQSHLYGIESQIWCNIPAARHCFNRTFMELKDLLQFLSAKGIRVSIAPLWNWKSRWKTQTCVGCAVSIAPLWNWKRKRWSGLIILTVVSIAPLWNWKCSTTTWLITATRFQSHLYGIERSIISPQTKQVVVSIAPLWNWKFVALQD